MCLMMWTLKAHHHLFFSLSLFISTKHKNFFFQKICTYTNNRKNIEHNTPTVVCWWENKESSAVSEEGEEEEDKTHDDDDYFCLCCVCASSLASLPAYFTYFTLMLLLMMMMIILWEDVCTRLTLVHIWKPIICIFTHTNKSHQSTTTIYQILPCQSWESYLKRRRIIRYIKCKHNRRKNENIMLFLTMCILEQKKRVYTQNRENSRKEEER